MRQIVTTYPPGLRRVEEKEQHLNDWIIVSPRAKSSTNVITAKPGEPEPVTVGESVRRGGESNVPRPRIQCGGQMYRCLELVQK